MSRKKNIVRIGVSLPSDLLNSLDELIKEACIESRSKALAEAIRMYIAEHSQIRAKEVTGALIVVYDHREKNTSEKIANIQHSYLDEIISAVHVHLPHHQCLLTVVVRGEAEKITKLANDIEKLKGVKVVRRALTILV